MICMIGLQGNVKMFLRTKNFTPCLSKPTNFSLSLSPPPLLFLYLSYVLPFPSPTMRATPTSSPNGVASLPLLSIEEAVGSIAFSSTQEYVLQ